MSKITIPKAQTDIGGSMNTWFFNEALSVSNIQKSTENGIQNIEGLIDMSIGDVADILTALGEVKEYLMAIKAPIALLDLDVPEDLPNNKTLDGAAQEVAKQFKDWLVPGSEKWLKDDNTEILFYTNPFAGNENSYLTGTEIKIIVDINGSVDALTIADAQAEIASGWEKLGE